MEQASAKRSICDRIADRLAALVGRTRFDRYFQDGARLRMEPERLAVSAPSAFYASWLEKGFGPALEQAARAETGNDGLVVVWLAEPELFACEASDRGVEAEADLPVDTRTARQDRAPSAVSVPAQGAQPASTGRGSSRSRRADAVLRHSLKDFVVGPSNRMAYEAADRLATAQEEPGFTSLFLHGSCGVGKTHLLQGLAARYLELRPGAQVRYVTGEVFTNEYISAVRAGKIDAFRAGLRRLDLLCLDDVHFLSNKTATQAEFLHTFDALELSGSRVAMASDEHPKEIAAFSQRLVSRCLSGMVVRVDLPDAATRAAIVRRMASLRGLRLSEAAEQAVVSQCAGSVRDLAGAVARVEALSRIAPDSSRGGEVGTVVVHRALGITAGAFSGLPGRPVSAMEILELVCGALGVDPSEALGRGRHKRVVLARSVAMHLARELTTLSYPEIATALSRPNHSTVITACQRVRKQIEQGETCDVGDMGQVTIADLCARLRARLASRTRAA